MCKNAITTNNQTTAWKKNRSNLRRKSIFKISIEPFERSTFWITFIVDNDNDDDDKHVDVDHSNDASKQSAIMCERPLIILGVYCV